MKTPLRNLTSEESIAIHSAACLHGRNFKSVIRECWTWGSYRRYSLADHEGTLRRMRNSADGHSLLSSLKVKDFMVSPATARAMGETAATNGGHNPFGVANLAKAWREGYIAARDNALISGKATPRSIPSI